jgi:hypothetical protein
LNAGTALNKIYFSEKKRLDDSTGYCKVDRFREAKLKARNDNIFNVP